nr:40S ribosomal protein S30 [Ipomoea batatas]
MITFNLVRRASKLPTVVSISCYSTFFPVNALATFVLSSRRIRERKPFQSAAGDLEIFPWVSTSLARAGNVRGQTPKVAKQDKKKKKPRGRAHKRMQYNRRFVTAAVGFGKKRGPNSSEK